MWQTTVISGVLKGQGISTKAAAERNRLIRRAIILLLVATVCALFCVWSRVRVVQIGYEVSTLNDEATELAKKVNHLKLEEDRLKSPGHLQKMATQILAMHPPSGEEIVFVRKASEDK